VGIHRIPRLPDEDSLEGDRGPVVLLDDGLDYAVNRRRCPRARLQPKPRILPLSEHGAVTRDAAIRKVVPDALARAELDVETAVRGRRAVPFRAGRGRSSLDLEDEEVKTG
jgi:hypothetical protein